MRFLRALGVLCVVLFPSLAAAQDSHFRPYLLGGRAAGMGGAFTALSDDASGSYYNPGGLAFSRRSSVSLSGSVYGLVQTEYDDLFLGRDYKTSNVNTFPVSTAGLYKLGTPDADGVAKHTLAFGVFVPDALLIDDRDGIGLETNALFLSGNTQTLWVGGGYAYKAGRLGLGAVLFAIQGTSKALIDISVTSPEFSNQFINITGREDMSYLGVLAGVGVRYDATERLSLGLSVYSPAVGTGSRQQFLRFNVGSDVLEPGSPPQQVNVVLDDLEAKPTQPLRVQAGVAYSAPRFTLAADAIYLAPRRVAMDEGDVIAEDIVRRTGVVNASVGAELLLLPKWPVRIGAFTDFPAVESLDDIDLDDPPGNTYEVTRFGGSFSVGYKTEHVVTDVGVNATLGSGRDLQPKDLDFERMVPTDMKERLLYIFLATAYEF